MVGVRACCGGADGGSCRTSFTSSTPAPRTGHTLHATLALHEYTSKAWFSSQKLVKNDTVAFSFLFDKHCPIIE